jgi:hypothetical protein
VAGGGGGVEDENLDQIIFSCNKIALSISLALERVPVISTGHSRCAQPT